jgi:hypothetical protein
MVVLDARRVLGHLERQSMESLRSDGAGDNFDQQQSCSSGGSACGQSFDDEFVSNGDHGADESESDGCRGIRGGNSQFSVKIAAAMAEVAWRKWPLLFR